MTSFIYRETLMNHLLIYGNAYSQIIRDGGGRVVSLHPLMPDRMRVSRENGKLIYTYWLNHNERSDGEHESGIITFPKEKILHIPGLGFDGLVGYSPIALAKNAVGMAIAAEEYGASFFANGASPSGVLEHPSSIGKNIDKVREAWDVIHKGTKNSGKIAVLEGGLKYTPLSVSPEEAQFLQTRKFQLNEIARIFRVPPHMIGDLEKSSFSNIEQQSLDFVKHCINPWVTRWEQAMWQNLLSPSEQRSGLYIKFNLDGLMRGDYETRMKGYSIGIQNGFFSPNDIRRLEEMDEIPAEEGGDAFLVNGNMKSVKKAAFGEQLEENHA
jgi:HK97 family phage portal protein